MRVILLGAPGAGKGTQAEILATKMQMPKLSTGEIVRAEIEANSELGKKIKELTNSGHLVSDDIMIEIVRRRLAKQDCEKGFVLEGFPRTVPQAEELSKILANMSGQPTYVIAFDVNEEFLVKRLSGRYICKKCGAGYHIEYNRPQEDGVCDRCQGTEFIHRADDDEASVKVRLKIYNEKTAPLIDYYNRIGLLHRVDGEQSIETISRRVDDVVKSNAKKLTAMSH
jgi:adenylate kinase